MIKALLFIFLSMSLVIALASRICHSRTWRMRAFCFRMAKNTAYREFYGKMTVVFLLLFHFVYQTLFGFRFGIPVSVVIALLMLRKNFGKNILTYISSNSKAMRRMFIFTLAMLVIPQCFSLAFTCGTLLAASIFYPQKKCGDGSTDEGHPKDMKQITDSYFKTFYK